MGFTTPLSNVIEDVNTPNLELNSNLSLNSTSQTILTEDKCEEVLKCVPKRTRIYEEGTPPQNKIQKPLKQADLCSTKSKGITCATII